MDFAETVKTTFRIYKARFGAMIGLGLIAGAAGGIAMVVFGLGGARWIDEAVGYMAFRTPDTGTSPMLAVGSLLSALIIFALYIVGWWVNLGLCAVTQGEFQGRRVSIGEATGTGLARLGSLVPVGAGLAVVLGLLMWALLQWVLDFGRQVVICQIDTCVAGTWTGYLIGIAIICVASLIAIVLSYILNVKWFLAFPVMVTERAAIWSALPRSWKITKGSGGIIFLIIFITGIALGAASQVAVLPVTWMTAPLAETSDPSMLLAQMWPAMLITSAITLAITVFALPILPIASQVVYQDRMRWAEPR